MVVAFTIVKLVMAVPLSFTAVAPVKSVPVTVTSVPVVVVPPGPEVGVKLVMVGAAATPRSSNVVRIPAAAPWFSKAWAEVLATISPSTAANWASFLPGRQVVEKTEKCFVFFKKWKTRKAKKC
jgi:hypothetical protein